MEITRARTTAVEWYIALVFALGAGLFTVSFYLEPVDEPGGLLLVVVGKIALGRSFGVVPANRGVVVRGPYALVRHPIYTGYLITHIAFLMAHPASWNVSVILLADVALVLRALMEERVLGADMAYQTYCRRAAGPVTPPRY